MKNSYKLRFWEKAWLIKFELVLGCFKLPCLFLFVERTLEENLLSGIAEHLKDSIYDWETLGDLKKYLEEGVHPELNILELIEYDMENSVTYGIERLNYFQWELLKDKLPYLNLYSLTNKY